jgi:hypothetical protein
VKWKEAVGKFWFFAYMRKQGEEWHVNVECWVGGISAVGFGSERCLDGWDVGSRLRIGKVEGKSATRWKKIRSASLNT